MATITNRGTGTHNTGATTLVCSPTSTIAAGSMGILAVSLDNAGSGGASVISPASVTDSVGNIWTRRQNPIFDNGAASAGIEGVIYTAHIVTQLTSGNNVTITWSPAASPVAKAYTFTEVTPGAGNRMEYLTGGTATGAAAANLTMSLGTVTSGDVGFAAYFSENVAAVTADSDTTNGSWSTQQTATIGATTSGVRIASQAKVTTGTGAQSYDVTVASQDRTGAWITLDEVPITVSATFTADSVLRAIVSATFTADSVLKSTVSPTFTADSVIKATVSPTFVADAVLRKATAATFTADSVIRINRGTYHDIVLGSDPDALFGLGDKVDIGQQVVEEIAGNHGTVTQGVIERADPPPLSSGHSGFFDADTDFTFPHSAATHPSNAFSIEFWIKRYVLPEVVSYVIWTEEDYRVEETSAGILRLTDSSGNPVYNLGFLAEEWAHVVFTRSGNVVKGYLNGVEAGSQVGGTVSFIEGTGDRVVGGAEGAGTNNTDMDLDDLAFYQRVLPASEVLAHYLGVGGPYSATADAVLLKTVSTTFTSDSVLLKTVTATFTADAVLSVAATTVDGSLTADAVLLKIVGVSYTADAVLQRIVSGSLTADAVLKTTVAQTFTADAYFRVVVEEDFTADAVLLKTASLSITADAVLLKVNAASFTTDAVLKSAVSNSFVANAVLYKLVSGSLTADAALRAIVSGSATADAVLKAAVAQTFAANAVLFKTVGNTFTADASIAIVVSGSFTADAVLVEPVNDTYEFTYTADAVLKKTESLTFTANSVLLSRVDQTFAANAVLRSEALGSITADAVLRVVSASTFDANAVLRVSTSVLINADAVLQATVAGTFTASAVIVGELGAITPDVTATVEPTAQVIATVTQTASTPDTSSGGTIQVTVSVESTVQVVTLVERNT